MKDNKSKKYDFKAIEAKWQDFWEKHPSPAEDFSDKPKFYNLNEFPYPSGYGLHVGHCMGWTASDAIARMKRMQGYNVLFPVGWDAFGLPTENFAIKTGRNPVDVTKESIDVFKKQMKSLGYSVDWNREIDTTDPNYYRWTQWIFLQFYKHAIIDGKLVKVADDDTETPRLAYQSEMPINWCPSCKIGLANEEVINGKCERCGTQTERRMQKQWMLRITAYADRLIDDLKLVDWEEKIKAQQTNWIGRSVGSNIKFKILNLEFTIEVFTTRADTLFGCTYIVLSPEHPTINNLQFSVSNFHEVKKYQEQARKKSDLERTELQKDKTGVELKGIKAINPINGEEVSIWVADYVLANYGTGAVMAVPAHDERDWEFAKKYDIPIKSVIKSKVESLKPNAAFTDYGVLINSGEFSNLSSDGGKKKITEKLKVWGAGDFSVNFKLRDWVFSRQHYWGEPIPIIYCRKCWENSKIKNQNSKSLKNVSIINGKEHMCVPLPESELPLTLPEVENYKPTNTGESPLSAIADWVNVSCPKCGGKARRETDTMPNWAGSSWYYLAYPQIQNLKFKNQNIGNIFEINHKELDYWLPVDLYNGGNEHTTLHLLYSRFWHKFLFDLGKVPDKEPYTKRVNHGIILGPDGQKMSKSKGNVINPDDMVKKFGADTMRAYIMFIGPYDQESAWSTTGIQGVFRFLSRVYTNAIKVTEEADSKELLIKLHQTIKGVSEDMEAFHFNTVVSKLMELNNTIEKVGHISKESYKKFLKLLYPVTPHLASELLEKNFNTPDDLTWPEVASRYLTSDNIEIVVQINGKIRDKLQVLAEISDDELKEKVMDLEKVKSNIEGKTIKKVIVVPKKLVSIVIDQ